METKNININKNFTNKNYTNRNKNIELKSIYSRAILTRKIEISINSIGKNIKNTIENYIKDNFEGKCVSEGFIKVDSTNLLTHTNGIIERGANLKFEVVFECYICFPVEGMLINCVVVNITKSVIRAEIVNEEISPVSIFIPIDYSNNLQITDIKLKEHIIIKVIGIRFQLNDKQISVIGKIVKDRDRNINIKT